MLINFKQYTVQCTYTHHYNGHFPLKSVLA